MEANWGVGVSESICMSTNDVMLKIRWLNTVQCEVIVVDALIRA